MRFLFIAGLVWTLSVPSMGDLITRHTNIKCETKDKSYLEVKLCRLKVLGRGIIGANVHFKLLQLPLTSVTINFGVWRKLSGYHPFLFNVTVDYCHYLRNPNPVNVFKALYEYELHLSYYYNIFPEQTDVILRDFVLEDKMFSKVPLPSGSYMFSVKLLGAGIWKGSVYSYMDLYVDNS